MEQRVYRVKDSMITVVFGDITRSRADVLVSSDDALLSMGGGVSRAIRLAVGRPLEVEARKHVPARLGDLVVTAAGSLPARYVFHAITIAPADGGIAPETIVRLATRKALQLTPLLGCRSVAFPLIGTGVAGIPVVEAAMQMAETIVGMLLIAPVPLTVELYLFDQFDRNQEVEMFGSVQEHLARALALQTKAVGDDYEIRPPGETDTTPSSERGRREQVFAMLQHLDARRNALESRLVDLLAQDEADVGILAQIRPQLHEIEGLRHGYEAELSPVAPVPAATPGSVFLSSTAQDLRAHRSALRDLIARRGLSFIGMEDFGPTALPPADLIRRKVLEAETYLGVLGMRYGFIDHASGLSMTELEYRQAVASGKEMLMFVMDGAAPITVAMVESDPDGFARLLAFRARVLRSHVCGLFVDVPDLARQAEHALASLGRGR